jgi:flagellar biosynthetic protein FliR
MATLSLPWDALQSGLLIFLRVAAIIFSAPIFDSTAIPVVFKLALALAVSVLLMPVVGAFSPPATDDVVVLGMRVLSEVTVGVIIGLSVKLLFAGIQLAGQIAGFQMGFAIANVVDPASDTQIPVLAQFYNLTAMLIFLAVNAHHMFFTALVDSYTRIPSLSLPFGARLVGMIMHLAANMFVVALKVGAPLIAVMLLASVALGLAARTVPQLHIFIVALPVKIFIGFAVLMIVAPYLTAFLVDLFAAYRLTLYDLLQVMSK